MERIPPTQASACHHPELPAHAIDVMWVSGCGKTTIAQSLAGVCGYAFYDSDDFHSPAHKAQMSSGVPLTDEQRESWIDRLAQQLKQQIHRGQSCVLAFSGLKRIHRQRLRRSGVLMQFVYLKTSPSVVAERLGHRSGHFMPASLLSSQLAALEPPLYEPDVISVDANRVASDVVASIVPLLSLTPPLACAVSHDEPR